MEDPFNSHARLGLLSLCNTCKLFYWLTDCLDFWSTRHKSAVLQVCLVFSLKHSNSNSLLLYYFLHYTRFRAYQRCLFSLKRPFGHIIIRYEVCVFVFVFICVCVCVCLCCCVFVCVCVLVPPLAESNKMQINQVNGRRKKGKLLTFGGERFQH